MRLNKTILLISIMFLCILPLGFSVDVQFTEAYNFNNLTGTGNLNLSGLNNTILTASGSPTATTGIIQNASKLVASSSQYMYSTGVYIPSGSTRKITLNAWIKPNDNNAATASSCYLGAGVYNIVTTANESDDIIHSICMANGGLRVEEYVQNVNVWNANYTIVFPTNVYSMVTMTMDGATRNISMYINGTLKYSAIASPRSAGSGTSFNGVYIGRSSNPSGYFNGSIDSVTIWNKVINSSDLLQVYNSGAGIEAPFTIITATNFTITANDFYTSSALTNFSATVNGVTYTTTNGTIVTALLTNATSLYNINLSSTENGGYFNKTLNNVNVSSALATTLSQSTITFTATEKVSNNTISGVNFTTSYLTNTTHYMRAQAYNVTASKSGYYNVTQQFTIDALSTTTKTVTNLSASRLNLTVKNAITGATVNTYTVQLTNTNYSYTENQSTTNGTVLADLIAGNWSLFVDATGYAYGYANSTLVGGVNNVTVYVYTTESIYFTFYNETTGSVLNGVNITLELIGSIASYNRTTSNGTIYIDLVTPSAYTLRYYATGGFASQYGVRFSYLTVTSRTTQNISLYLLASSALSNITTTVYSQDGNLVESALVKALKYDLVTNSYIVREQVLTNSQGQAEFEVLFNTEYYKFIVEYPVGTVALTTNPAYINSYDISLVLTSGATGSDYREVLDADGNVLYNSVTGSFRFDWSDSSNTVTQACLYVYRLNANFTGNLINNSCVAGTGGGSLPLAFNNLTGFQYYAKGYLTIDGTSYNVDNAWANLVIAQAFGKTGLVIAIIITVAIAFIFIGNPTTFILTLPVGVTLTNLFGLTYFSQWVIFTLWILVVIITFSMGRSK